MSNSLHRSVTPLVLEAGPSRWVSYVTLAGFTLALIAFVMLPLPVPLTISGVPLLAVAFVYSWRRHHALGGQPVTVRLDSDGHWHWQQREGSEEVSLLADSYHAPFLVILNFRGSGWRSLRRTLLLTRDNIDADTLRRLQVHLKWQEQRSQAEDLPK